MPDFFDRLAFYAKADIFAVLRTCRKAKQIGRQLFASVTFWRRWADGISCGLLRTLLSKDGIPHDPSALVARVARMLAKRYLFYQKCINSIMLPKRFAEGIQMYKSDKERFPEWFLGSQFFHALWRIRTRIRIDDLEARFDNDPRSEIGLQKKESLFALDCHRHTNGRHHRACMYPSWASRRRHQPDEMHAMESAARSWALRARFQIPNHEVLNPPRIVRLILDMAVPQWTKRSADIAPNSVDSQWCLESLVIDKPRHAQNEHGILQLVHLDDLIKETDPLWIQLREANTWIQQEITSCEIGDPVRSMMNLDCRLQFRVQCDGHTDPQRSSTIEILWGANKNLRIIGYLHHEAQAPAGQWYFCPVVDYLQSKDVKSCVWDVLRIVLFLNRPYGVSVLGKWMARCLICHKPLVRPFAILHGMGKDCWAKFGDLIGDQPPGFVEQWEEWNKQHGVQESGKKRKRADDTAEQRPKKKAKSTE
jgi:hypothetical protein